MKVKTFIYLQLISLLYSVNNIFSKLASNETFMSFRYILFMSLMVCVLGLYAIVWQQILKKVNLSVAFASKGTTILWTILIGYILFNESVSYMQIIGALIVIIGIIVIASGEKTNE